MTDPNFLFPDTIEPLDSVTQEALDFFLTGTGYIDKPDPSLTGISQLIKNGFLTTCQMGGSLWIYHPLRVTVHVVRFKFPELQMVRDGDGKIQPRNSDVEMQRGHVRRFIAEWIGNSDKVSHEVAAYYTFLYTYARHCLLNVPAFLWEQFLDITKKANIDWVMLTPASRRTRCNYCGTIFELRVKKHKVLCPSCGHNTIVRES